MKLTKVISALFALVGAAVAAFAVYLSFEYMNASPVLLGTADAAKSSVVQVFDTVCAGEYDAAGAMMYGKPVLGVDREASDEVGALVWDAFVQSLSYELVGDCYATDSGVAQNVRFSCLEIGSVTENLRQRSQDLLAQRVADAQDVSEIYNENNEYREELVMEVLYIAAEQALQEDAKTTSAEFTVNLIYHEGQWRVVPEDAMLRAISGGIAG